jgi:predicted amidohydrolase/HEAT repeat protein
MKRLLLLVAALVGIGAAPRGAIADPPAQPSVKIAGLVLRWLRGDKEANFRRLEPMIREAAAKGAKIVVTTECSLDGYAVADRKNLSDADWRDLGEPIPSGVYFKKLAALAKELKIFLVVGLTEADGDERYNTVVIIGPDGKLVGKYRKQNLGHEEGRNTPGTLSSVFATEFGKVGVMICADRTDPKIVKRFCDNGADFLICPSGGMFGPKTNDPIVQARSKENKIHIVFVHPVEFLATGPDGGILQRELLGSNLVVTKEQRDGKEDERRIHYFQMPLKRSTPAAPIVDQETIEGWIGDLTAMDFRRRETTAARLSAGGRPAIAALVRALPALDLEGRRRAEAILQTIDPIFVNAPALSAKDLDERRAALTALRGFRDPRLVNLLLPRLTAEDDYHTLAEVIALLALQKDRRATKLLISLIETMVKQYDPKKATGGPDKNSHVNGVVVSALHALGTIGDPAAFEPLAKSYQDRKSSMDKGERFLVQLDYADVGHAVIHALGGTRRPEAIDILLDVSRLKYGEATVFPIAHEVREAIIGVGPPAVPYLVKTLRHDPLKAPVIAVQALGELGDTTAVAPLVDLLGKLEKASPWYAVHVVIALDKLGSDRGVEWVTSRRKAVKLEDGEAMRFALAKCRNPKLREHCLKMLQEDKFTSQLSASKALGRMGDERGPAFLRSKLTDPMLDHWAVEALTDLKDKKSIPQLIEMVKDERPYRVNMAVRALASFKLDAARELVRVKTKKSIEALIAMRTDEDDQKSAAANQVLWEIIGANLSYDRWGPVSRSFVVERIENWWKFHRGDYPD